MKTTKVRLAVVVSHPIPAFNPQYVSWARLPHIELRVFFASSAGLTDYFDDQFGKVVKWNGMALNFPHEFIAGAETRPLSDGIDAPEVDKHLQNFQPDVVLIYGYGQAVSRRAMRWAGRNAAQLLMLADTEGRSHRSVVKRLLKKIALPIVLRKVTLFLTVGDSNEEFYRRYGVSDTRFVRCCFPVDRQSFDERSRDGTERRRIRSTLGIPAHHKVLLNVGKLVPRKRQRDLVEFSNDLQGQRDDVTVVLVGTGGDEADLRRLCRREGSGGVIFAGIIQPSEVADYYQASDVYVACSSRDAHSYAISEAIYAGLPVIVSDRCGSYGPTDDVRPGLNGFVYRCGDVAQLSNALFRLLDDEQLLSSMSDASARIGRYHQDLAHGQGLTQALQLIAGGGAVVRAATGPRSPREVGTTAVS